MKTDITDMFSEEEMLEYRLTFGKYNGYKLKDVDLGYLRWMIDSKVGDTPLKEILEYFEDVYGASICEDAGEPSDTYTLGWLVR